MSNQNEQSKKDLEELRFAMNTLKLLILLCPLILTALAPIAQAQEPPLRVDEFTLDIQCYTPTKITFNYAYTHEHGIYDISTVGASLYKHTGGPTFMEFIAEQVDDYQFSVSLTYITPTNQSVLVGLWSGTEAMDGYDYKGDFQKVIFHVKLHVLKERTYPSEQEVANQVVAQVQKNLDEYVKAQNKIIENQNTAIYVLAGISSISVIAIIVLTIIVALELRKPRRQG